MEKHFSLTYLINCVCFIIMPRQLKNKRAAVAVSTTFGLPQRVVRRRQAKQKQHRVKVQKQVVSSSRGSRRARRRNRGRLDRGVFPRALGKSMDFFPSEIMTNVNRRSQIVTEDEFVSDVFGSVGFVTTAFPLNPGQASLFPWGNKIAQLYERYQFLHCVPYYKPQVSGFATNGQAGKVMLSCDYDALDAAPTTKQQVEDTVPHVDCMPYQSMALPLDVRQMATSDAKYVRPGAVPAGGDIKTYDAGTIYVSTQGNTNTTVIGEFRIRYSYRLETPILDSPLGVGLTQAHIVEGAAGTAAAAGSSFLGTTGGVLRAGSTLPTVVTKNTFTLPLPGSYLVSAVFVGSVTAGATFTGGSNISAVQIISDNAAAAESIANGATAAAWIGVLSVSAAGIAAANTVTITGLANLAAGTADIFISQISSGLLLPKTESNVLAERVARLETLLKILDASKTDGLCGYETDEEDLVSVVSEKGTSYHIPKMASGEARIRAMPRKAILDKP